MTLFGDGAGRLRRLCAAAVALTLVGATGARAAEPHSPALTLGLDYKLDSVGVLGGGATRGTDLLDGLTLSADLDLDRAVGWAGGSAHLDLLNTSGDAPSLRAGALQGVDALEVSAQRLRLYQAWLEQSLAGGLVNLRLGFSDVSGEFAVADASGLLLNPSFGMAPDFAASGAAAYPSTSLGLRVRVEPSPTTYLQAALVNARTGVPGDDGGADLSFDDGTVLAAEAGATARGKVAVGYWRLTRRQDDLATLDAAGQPVRRTAQGAYALVEQPLTEGPVRALTGFLRAGISEGRTGPFRGSVQAGLLAAPLFAGRPDSSLTVGVTYAALGRAYRDASILAGGPALDRGETVLELAYSDELNDKVRLQPGLQFIHRPGGDPQVKDAVVASLRVDIGF
ncbi:carbohydrate porin [Phenylobacterium sp.]|uniref:carbohydrate porin n=1 Tax=Phenylobacterium sp. TaxID=1871053 RepID=UPI003BAA103F